MTVYLTSLRFAITQKVFSLKGLSIHVAALNALDAAAPSAALEIFLAVGGSLARMADTSASGVTLCFFFALPLPALPLPTFLTGLQNTFQVVLFFFNPGEWRVLSRRLCSAPPGSHLSSDFGLLWIAKS
jgi:hypothetical protein